MWKAIAVLVGCLCAGEGLTKDALWDNRIASPVGVSYRVSPGQVVYREVQLDRVPIYELTQRVESKMRGSMGLKFWFAIEPGPLTALASDSEWTYFGVRKGRAKAWHGMIGDVLAGDDHVGVRKSNAGGDLEWYVDNSIYNSSTTIWKRKVKAAELSLLRADTIEDENGNPVRELTYLGKSQGELRFRLKELTPAGSTSDVFAYEVAPEEDTVVSVLGAEIHVSEISNTGAKLTMLKPFDTLVTVESAKN